MEPLLHPFPWIRGGGLFLVSVGAGFLLGWLLPRFWVPFAAIGLAAGIAGTMLAGAFEPDFGMATTNQLIWFGAAIALQSVAIPLALRFVRDDDRQTVAILFIVGAHFAPMAVTFGPLMLVLALATMANAVFAWRALPGVDLTPFGVVDALLKIVIGSIMFAWYPRWGG